MSRYVVTELEGYDRPVNYVTSMGLSCMVLDTLWNHRVVGTFRSEDYGGTVTRRHEEARYRAHRLAAELNDEPPPEFSRSWQFKPTCPKCGRRADPDAAYCRCGKNLYRQEVGH